MSERSPWSNCLGHETEGYGEACDPRVTDSTKR